MILKIIYGLIILGIIVFIHELGHFIAALVCKVKVEAFSIGMGPVLIHKTFKNIDWRISLFPLGGYCAMKGEKDIQEALENDEETFYADNDSLYGVHPLKTALIGFAGPFFNLLLTFFSFYVIAVTGFTYWSASNQIQIATEIFPEISSPAKDAGILTGDKIIKINNEEINDFYELYGFIAVHPDEDLNVTVLRDNEILEYKVHTLMDKNSGSGKLGVVSLPQTAKLREAKRYNPLSALKQSFKETIKMIKATLKGIASLFKGVKITSAVSGPASITTMLGDTVQSGFSAGLRNGITSVLNFVALISISLFIMNLLPVPVLDGGLIFLSLIEAIFKIRISPKVRYRIQYIGLAFIAFLFVIAMIGDFNFFMRLFNEK